MKKLKKFFTEERVDEIYETMFEISHGTGTSTHGSNPNPLRCV